jgi:hypothetical protein
MTNRNSMISAISILFSFSLLMSEAGARPQQGFEVGSERNSAPQQAVSINMTQIPLEFDAQTPKPARIIKKHKYPFDVDQTYLKQIKEASHTEGQAIAVIDPGTGSEAQKTPTDATPCHSYPGIGSTGWNPPDPHAAVGENHVVVVVNSSIAIYSKYSGTPLYQVTGETFFAPVVPPSGFIFDPKVVYDPFEDRFIILFLCSDDVEFESSYLVAVSKTSDPMGGWWLYDLDAAMNGSTPVDHWPDYPGLGFDYSDAVYITSNQWGFTTGYQYVKVRILLKDELYSGTISGWHDLWGMRYHDSSVAFTMKPAVTLSDAGGEYLLSNIWYGANYTTYWKIENVLSGEPTITLMPKVNLGASYTVPPNPNQPITAAVFDALGPMTQDVFFRNGKLYTAFSQSYDWGGDEVAALRLIGINTPGATAFLNQVYGANNIHYFFPAIATDFRDRVYLVFSRSSSSEYASIYVTEDYVSNPAANRLRSGLSYIGSSGTERWGDYGGISADPDGRSVWVYHEWATTGHNWSTWVGEIPGAPTQATLATPADNSNLPGPPYSFDWSSLSVTDTFVIEIDDSATFATPILNDISETSAFQTSAPLIPGYRYYWHVKGWNHCGETSFTIPWSFKPCGTMHGDVNASSIIDIDDVVFLIMYVFAGGPAPSPEWLGDVNCDQLTDIDDIVYLISYIFGGGSAPCGGC